VSGHNSKYSNLFNAEAENSNGNGSMGGIIPQKPKFGITGYKHAKQGWLDRP